MISIIIPIFNEEENLPELFRRLHPVLENCGEPFEVILIDDGSRDRSTQIIKDQIAKFPQYQLVRFNRNYGQHPAIFAGFEKAQGDIIVTLDADLQNPPEEIPKLIAKMKEGYEVVSGYREHRNDSILRKIPSFFVAKITSRLIGVPMKDYGCMLRAYRKELVKLMCENGGSSAYIPALANSYAASVTEIPVEHRSRAKGKSKYNLIKLLHLNFDLMTSFSLLPIQLTGLLGVGIAFSGLAFSIFLIIMRLVRGAEWAAQGVFTLFGILFFFIGLQVLVIALMGEYIGRIYQEVRKRPKYRIQEVIKHDTH